MKLKILCVLFAMITPLAENASSADVATEDKIKAAYVYHIINFVTWPQAAVTNANLPITICLMGEVAIEHSLYALQNREVKNRIIKIKRISSTRGQFGCQILFIGDYSIQRLKEILNDANNQAVLTIADFPGFVELGGMIDFTKRGNHIRLEINLDATNKAGITISAKLAEVAVNIIGGPEQKQ
jgi:hypothetical protein